MGERSTAWSICGMRPVEVKQKMHKNRDTRDPCSVPSPLNQCDTHQSAQWQAARSTCLLFRFLLGIEKLDGGLQ